MECSLCSQIDKSTETHSFLVTACHGESTARRFFDFIAFSSHLLDRVQVNLVGETEESIAAEIQQPV
jgi:hypothetical protein